MYQQTRPSNPNERYFTDAKGEHYRSVAVGFHIRTGEQYVVMRKISDGTTWVVPYTELRETKLIAGEPVRTWYEEIPAIENVPTSRGYCGYTNDPRTERNDPRVGFAKR